MSEAELNRLAAALQELLPAAPRDRDRLMFSAGRASRPPRWGWPVATVLASLLAVAFGLALLLRPAVHPRTQYVFVPAPPPPSPVPPVIPAPPDSDLMLSPSGMPPYTNPEPDWQVSPYQQLQEQILRWGLDAVPQPQPLTPPGPPQTVKEFLKSLEP